jgi:hypothetical protein
VVESQWLSCADPAALLASLRASPRASDRKLRLFGVACCRRIWDLLPDTRSHEAVEVAERLADGLATDRERDNACAGANAAQLERDPDGPAFDQDPSYPALVAWYAAQAPIVCYHPPYDASSVSACALSLHTAYERHGGRPTAQPDPEYVAAYAAERVEQARLVRDLFGNPFRPPPALRPAWRRKGVIELARSLYDGRQFGDLAVLGDALEEAGCDNAEILEHLRGAGPHARGCWALDLVRAVD